MVIVASHVRTDNYLNEGHHLSLHSGNSNTALMNEKPVSNRKHPDISQNIQPSQQSIGKIQVKTVLYLWELEADKPTLSPFTNASLIHYPWTHIHTKASLHLPKDDVSFFPPRQSHIDTTRGLVSTSVETFSAPTQNSICHNTSFFETVDLVREYSIQKLPNPGPYMPLCILITNFIKIMPFMIISFLRRHTLNAKD
ncbi:hypothetical protein AMTRI_Chr11g156160 [Amborella trichopoda]